MRTYYQQKDGLFLHYLPYNGVDSIRNYLKENDEIMLARTFTFKATEIIWNNNENDEDPFESFDYQIGTMVNGMIKLDKNVFSIKHDVYLSPNIKLFDKYFVYNGKISVFEILDDYAKEDIQIIDDKDMVDSQETKNAIPFLIFKQLIQKFPTATESYYYRLSAIDAIIGEFFPHTPDYLSKYETYIEKHRRVDFEKPVYPRESESAIINLTGIKKELEFLLANDKLTEHEWQTKIAQILLLLYPKYLVVLPSVKIYDNDGKSRQLDFLFVDNEGNGDVLEIKKPFANSVMSELPYRDNYVPKRELSGAVIQCEKYLYYLTSNKDKNEDIINRLKEKDLRGLKVRLTNPQSLVLVGRSNNLTDRQKLDFEIFKRSHKSITEILTYDDLLIRINNSLDFLIRRDTKKS